MQQPRPARGPRRHDEFGCGGVHEVYLLAADRLIGVRTAVVRVGVDTAGELAPAQLDEGMTRLRELAGAAGAELVDNNLAAMPAKRREVELLIAGDDTDELQ